MKRSKFLIPVLTMLLVLAAMTACQQDSVTGATATPAGGATRTPSSTAQAPGTTDSGEKPVLKYLTSYSNTIDMANDPTAKAIEEVTGYTVEYYVLPSDNTAEKLNLEMSAGTAYDVMRLHKQYYAKLIDQNVLMPLDDLLNEYGQTIKAEYYPDFWKIGMYEGQIYSIPYMNDRATIWNTILVRQDILDELGLMMPTTADELYDVMDAIAQGKDIIPMTGPASTFIGTITSAFGLYINGWNEADGQLIYMTEMPEFTAYMDFMARCYGEGLLDPDWGINKTANSEEKFTSGQAAMMPFGITSAGTVVPAVAANVEGAELGLMQPLKDADGSARIQASYAWESAVCIPKTAEHPADAMKWMDLRQQEDNFLYIHLGVEGTDFEIRDGRYYPIMPRFSEQRGNAYLFFTTKNDLTYADMWLARIWRNEDMGRFYDILNKDFDSLAVYDPLRFAPPLPESASYNQTLSQMTTDFCLQYIMGEKTADDIEAFNAEFNQAGGDKVRVEYNDWFSENGVDFNITIEFKPITGLND